MKPKKKTHKEHFAIYDKVLMEIMIRLQVVEKKIEIMNTPKEKEQ